MYSFDSDFPLDLLALSGMSVGYFFIYIPKFIEIKNYLTDLMKDYETEK